MSYSLSATFERLESVIIKWLCLFSIYNSYWWICFLEVWLTPIIPFWHDSVWMLLPIWTYYSKAFIKSSAPCHKPELTAVLHFLLKCNILTHHVKALDARGYCLCVFLHPAASWNQGTNSILSFISPSVCFFSSDGVFSMKCSPFLRLGVCRNAHSRPK